MKKNKYSFNSAIVGISLSLLLSAAVSVGCTKSGEKKEENPTALLYLVNNSNSVNDVQSQCLIAYTAANSCVGGNEFFNAGRGCSIVKLEGKTVADYVALRECVLKKVNDTVQPCSLPQFRYALASQAIAGAFADCNKAYTPSSGTEVDLKDYLVY